MKVVILLLAALWAGIVPDPEGAPRNVRLRAETVGDSISFDLRWVAPQRTGRQTPIEGYEWEFWTSGDPNAPWANLAKTGTNEESARQVLAVLPFDCSAPATFYTARVRAIGQFSAPAPWGSSPSVAVICDNSPPGPPTVDLDTIAIDTSTEPADSLVLLPVDLGEVLWNRSTQSLGFQSLGDTARLCAFSYRGGEQIGKLIPRGFRVATIGDTAQVITNTDILEVSEAEPLESACWDVVSVGTGGAKVYLCTTDCPAGLAGFDIRFLPAALKWPLLLLGLALIVGDLANDARKRKRLFRNWKAR